MGNEKAKAEVAAAYVKAILARLKMNGNSGWGGKDAVATIEAVFEVAVEYPEEGFDLIRTQVAEQVNPSAFRSAKLESEEKGSPFHVPKGEKRGAKTGALSAALAAAGIALP